MFQINAEHRLTGSTAAGQVAGYAPSPNCNGPASLKPRLLVFHYTACGFGPARSAFLNGKAANRVSAHLLVDRDGSVLQFVPFDQRAWHAGTSFWAGLTDINSHSIGIEVVNLGYLLKRADGRYTSADGTATVDAADVVQARHPNPAERHELWHAYTPAQIETCTQLAALLVQHYSLSEIVGHQDIAPTRKIDPGPAFPMRRMAAAAFDRQDASATAPAPAPAAPGAPAPAPALQTLYVAVPQLNFRQGPGADFPLIGPALVEHCAVQPLQPARNGWLQVQAQVAPPDIGWVAANYLRATP